MIKLLNWYFNNLERRFGLYMGKDIPRDPSLRPCPVCGGDGLLDSGDVCPTCHGSGEIRE